MMSKKMTVLGGLGGAFVASAVVAASLVPTTASTAATGASETAGEASINGLNIAALRRPGVLPADDELQETARALGVPSHAFHSVGKAWVAEKPGLVCAVALKHGGGCWRADAAKTGNLAFEFRTADNVVTRTGIVPDGYSRAVARDVAGAELDAVPVVENMYSLTAKDVRTIEFEGADLPTLTVSVLE